MMDEPIIETDIASEPIPKKILAKRQRRNTGRPIENPAWEHYTYDADTGKTSCNHCPMSLKGKHTTNLVRHLMRHPSEYAQFSLKDAAREKKGRSLSLTAEPITAQNVNVSLKRKSQCITIEIVTPDKIKEKKMRKNKNISDLIVTEVPAPLETATSLSTATIKVVDTASGRPPPRPIETRDGLTKEQKMTFQERNKKFRDLLVELIGTTSVPAQILENEVFRKMINFLDPEINVPSRETLGREVNRANSEIKKEMRDLISGCDKLTIGINICSKKTVACGYLGVVAYFYRKDLKKYFTLALGLRELKSPQSNSEITEVLTKILQEYGIERRQLNRMIAGTGGKIDSDGSIVMDEAQEASIYLNVHFCDNQPQTCNESCYASAIQVISTETQVRRLQCFVNQLQSVWKPHEKKSHFDDSVTAASKLIQVLGKAGAKIDYLLDDSGKSLKARKRWLPIFSKIQHLVKSKETINQICDEEGLEQLSVYHWQRLDKFVELFSPFKLVKDQQNVMDESIISRVIPSIYYLKNHLNKQITEPSDYECRDLASTLLYHLDTKLNYIMDQNAEGFDEIFIVATYLDPAVQKVLTRDQVALSLSHLDNIYRTSYSEESTANEGASTGQRVADEEDAFEQFLNSSTPSNSRHAALNAEIDAYHDFLARKTIAHKTDPLHFWATEPLRLPILQKLAFDILSVPSSAHAIEQLFMIACYSSEGPRNARINAETLESKVLLKFNRPSLKFFDT